MAIFLNKDSKVIVQGMTGATGMKHTKLMLADGTIGGVNPRKAGTSVDIDGTEIPVHGCGGLWTRWCVVVLFAPRRAFAKAAVVEAIDADISSRSSSPRASPSTTPPPSGRAKSKGNKTRIIGPNCPGSITPGQSNAGIIPGDITKPGRIGLVSKSGTLTYQMMYELRDIGFSSAVGIGGDPIIGTTHIDALAAFEADPDTDLIVMIGEIGGDAEERAADFIAKNVTQPVCRLRRPASPRPRARPMVYAGAIVSGSSGTAAAKKEALEAAGVEARQDADRDGEPGPRDPRRLTFSRPTARIPTACEPVVVPGSACLRNQPLGAPTVSPLSLARRASSSAGQRSGCDPGAPHTVAPQAAQLVRGRTERQCGDADEDDRESDGGAGPVPGAPPSAQRTVVGFAARSRSAEATSASRRCNSFGSASSGSRVTTASRACSSRLAAAGVLASVSAAVSGRSSPTPS